MPLNPAQIPAAVPLGFAAALGQGTLWADGALKPTKDLLIGFLLVEQGAKCAYCRRDLQWEQGRLELDHVLPQGSAGKAPKQISNLVKHRYCTVGYPEWRFEPTNLILTCKRCNNRKANYDCRTNRAVQVAAYPAAAADFLWIHPYHHDYDDHITILKDFVYQEVPGSNGLAVIDACKLAGIAAIETRARELHRAQLKDATKLALRMLVVDEATDQQVVNAVRLQFPLVSVAKIRAFLARHHKNKLP